MKPRTSLTRVQTALTLSIISLQLSLSVGFTQNTVFTYQGIVTDNGTNFTGAGLFGFALVTSSNANLQATATVGLNQPSGGYITVYTVTSAGSGYVSAPAVTVSGGGGTGATAVAHVNGGMVVSISVGSPGDGNYTSAPTVTIAPPPQNVVYVTHWSNDGTSVNGSEPAAPVSVAVTNGLFTVVLGDTSIPNMTNIPSSVFSQAGLQLRIWFSDGISGFAALSPVQNLTPTPYSVSASSAGSISGTVSAAQISGAVGSANLSGTYANILILSNAGNNFSGTFTGSGANLTGLDASNLSSGVVPLARLNGITSNQLDPATWQLATNANGGSAALASNVVSGIRITNAFITNSIFAGDGSGLSNVTAAVLATPVNTGLVPAGSFTMGNSVGDADITDATPTNITVSAFSMDLSLVTYARWQSVYYWATSHGYTFVNGGAGKAANHPVQSVDWFDSVKWCNARSQQAGLTPVYYTDAGLTQVFTNGDKGTTVYPNWSANGFRLPTEAEWEKAARGGLGSQRFPWGNTITEYLANYYGMTSSGYDLGPNGYNTTFTSGSAPYTSTTGYFAPNGFGLFDVAGNLWQWCWDWYGTPYGQPTSTNPTGPASGVYRVVRGGAWSDGPSYTRSALRNGSSPEVVILRTGGSTDTANNIGFRCVGGH